MTFQNVLLTLERFWSERGCLIVQPYDMEVGAGTMSPHTLLRALGPEPWNAAYVQPSRRPADGRYARNPMRLQHYYQYQVVLKPSPENVVDLYMESLVELGFDTKKHDIRLVEDDWASEAIGASGVGWEVWIDGMEITQFTYFQQIAGLECKPVSAEITYGPERLATLLQKVSSVWELEWAHGVTYKDVAYEFEIENNIYNFEQAATDMLQQTFDAFEKESRRCADLELIAPAFDFVLKCSHIFNLLDARGKVSVTERANFINRIRGMSRRCCLNYLAKREKLGFPLLKSKVEV